jgi:Flp pilus assembly pilin Flp
LRLVTPSTTAGADVKTSISGKKSEGGKSQMKFTQFIKNLHREESGQDMLEYALVTAAVLAAVVSGSQSLATNITDALGVINGKITAEINKLQ